MNVNVFSINKLAMKKEVLKNPTHYPEAIVLFKDKQTFVDNFSLFEKKACKEINEFEKERFFAAFTKMNTKVLDSSEVKRLVTFLENTVVGINLNIFK